MKGLISTLFAIALLASAALADSNRVLLRPPDNYEGVTIGGVQFVHGQVYLPQAADTALLTKFGFRDFTWAGSSSRYKKFKAWWPLDTDVDLLPDAVIGLTYDKLTNEDLSYAAIMQPQSIPSELRKNIDGLRFAGMRPSDGKPDLMLGNRPYVEGKMFFEREPNSKELRDLGVRIYERLNDEEPSALVLSGQYIQYDAMWPMDLDPELLPSYVVGVVANKSRPEYYDQYAQQGRVNNYYYGSQPSTVRVYHYGSSRSGWDYYGDTRYLSWRHDFDPNAYYYKTRSRTTLRPTTIGSTPANKYLRRKGARYYCR